MYTDSSIGINQQKHLYCTESQIQVFSDVWAGVNNKTVDEYNTMDIVIDRKYS